MSNARTRCRLEVGAAPATSARGNGRLPALELRTVAMRAPPLVTSTVRRERGRCQGGRWEWSSSDIGCPHRRWVRGNPLPTELLCRHGAIGTGRGQEPGPVSGPAFPGGRPPRISYGAPSGTACYTAEWPGCTIDRDPFRA